MTIWRVDDDLPYLCSLVRHSVSQNIVLMLSIRRTTLSFFFRLFWCGQIQEQLSGIMFINNKINHIFHTTWGGFKHILYLCMFAKVFHGTLLSSIYVWYTIVRSKVSDNSIIIIRFQQLVEWFYSNNKPYLTNIFTTFKFQLCQRLNNNAAIL